MRVQTSTTEDIPVILDLYRRAVDYQRNNGFNLWPEFEQDMLRKEISEGRNYKIVSENEIAGSFAVAYSDPVIWKELEKNDAIYLHRIVTNPQYKGKGLMRVVKEWSAEHARAQNRKYLRMDTWGNNENLKKYYVQCGFTYLGQQTLSGPNSLAPHYWGTTLSLFQIDL